MAAFYVLTCLLMHNYTQSAVNARYTVWPTWGWGLGMGSAVLWILTGLLSCCARPASAPLRATLHPLRPYIDQALSGAGQCLHTSKHAQPPAWWGAWCRAPSAGPSCWDALCVGASQAARPGYASIAGSDTGTNASKSARDAAASRPTQSAAGAAATSSLTPGSGPSCPCACVHGLVLVRAWADACGGAAGIPRRRSADYVKQADAAPLQRPRPGAGPTGAMLAPGNGDIEMGARNGLGNGAPPPTAPVRPPTSRPGPHAPQACTASCMVSLRGAAVQLLSLWMQAPYCHCGCPACP